MKRKLLSIISVGIAMTFAFGVWAGAYPVVIVDHKMISYRQWEKARAASIHFAFFDERRKKRSKVAADLQIADTRHEIERDVLNFLIDQLVLREEGGKLVPNLEQESRRRLLAAIASGGNLEQTAERLYGVGRSDMESLILLPQARQEVVLEALAKKGIAPEQWFPESKKRKNVKIYFLPYRWNGSTAEPE